MCMLIIYFSTIMMFTIIKLNKSIKYKKAEASDVFCFCLYLELQFLKFYSCFAFSVCKLNFFPIKSYDTKRMFSKRQEIAGS